jgi:hypothetical protein
LLAFERNGPARREDGANAIRNASVAARLERAKAAGELRADVDTTVLTVLIDGPVLHAALSGLPGVDDAWIADLVSVVLDGARSVPPARRRAPSRTRSDRTRPEASEVLPR